MNLIPELVAVRNKTMPKAGSNVDPLIHDYDFWSEIEKLAKKERKKSLDAALGTVKPVTKPGIVVKGSNRSIHLKMSDPIKRFDKELFIEKLVDEFKLLRHKVREVATASVAVGEPRKTFEVIDNA